MVKSLRQRVIDVFEEYGGWWWVEGMAERLNAGMEEVRKVYDDLEKEGLTERKVGRGKKI